MEKKSISEKSPFEKNCFTLIELLVVIAIISVLMAMLLPSLKNAKDKAKQIVCTSNMKNIISTWSMYCTDWGGHMPPRSNGVSGGGNNGNWYYYNGSLGSSVWGSETSTKKVGVLACPSRAEWYNRNDWDSLQIPYGYNVAVGQAANDNWSQFFDVKIKFPSKLVVFCDGMSSGWNHNGTLYSGCFDQGFDVSSMAGVGSYYGSGSVPGWSNWCRRHFKGGNIAFSDGHVGFSKDFQGDKDAKQLTGELNPYYFYTDGNGVVVENNIWK